MRKVIVCLCLLALVYGLFTMSASQKSEAISTLNSMTQRIAQSVSQDQSTGVEGKPTISVDLINRILAANHSKAVGTGQALYQYGVTYGIDPVYALAFFLHESSFGTTGVARVTLSLGNIRCTPGYQCIKGYRAYASWQQGYADWYKLIRNLYISQWGLRTVEQIIPTYAPSSDHNDVAGYIAAVENAVKIWRTGKIATAGVN